MLDTPGEIGDGGNSGFQALNLAVRFGARRIVLIGFDMRLDLGIHWHGSHGRGMNNPSQGNVLKWRERFNAQEAYFRRRGIEVFRENDVSTLLAYPVISLSDAFRKWL